MAGSYLIVIYGAPFSGTSELAWRVARGLHDQAAVVSMDQLLNGAIAVPGRDHEAELEMVNIQLRLLVANYLKNRYHVVVEGPFVFERDGRVFDYQAEIGQLVALMRILAHASLIVRLDAPEDVTLRRAERAGQTAQAAVANRLRALYTDRYEGRVLRLESGEDDIEGLARRVWERVAQSP